MNNTYGTYGTNENNGTLIYMNSRELTTMEDFKEKLLPLLESPGFRVDCHDVYKNNGITKTGLTIVDEAGNGNKSTVSPCIYLEGYLREYRNGASLEKIAEDIVKLYEESKLEVRNSMDFRFLRDFNKVKDMLCFQIINAEKNSRSLKETPHILMYDFAVVFRVYVEFVEGSIRVKNHFMEMWGKTAEELFDVALSNTSKLFPADIISKRDLFLKEMGLFMSPEENEEVLQSMGPDMFVCSNAGRCNGAGVIFYEGLLQSFGKEHGSFFVLPSSIHECIFLVDNGEMDKEYLLNMVNDNNATQVAEDEVLSNNIYYYDAENDFLDIIYL